MKDSDPKERDQSRSRRSRKKLIQMYSVNNRQELEEWLQVFPKLIQDFCMDHRMEN